ncbi:type I restriction endonuclease subunit R [Legionella hackeliae]|uniref:Type I restriction enzyme endonuclease subunit n=1 Tax=Legionella hackeliae TaxID=449 RepID=A0A0A8UWA9_LEGHA|nr:type I restriction endonuclease subunit R [Legionella hackeliae]KTD09639.1 type-1 restriction system, restriction subunit [Legionella hackeliae]CEK11044.1 putative type I restriction enzyme HindVIIP R protein [Legionella hackeliae]STX47788.1 type-1 restriction system, restriction subunit [Legionella hackeliae]
MTEDKLEQEMLTWLTEIGYTHVYGPTIACDGEASERSNYQDILLIERLQRAINQLNPEIPSIAREDALQQVRDLNTPILLSANRRFHHFLVNGVPVEYQKGGETRGDFVRLIDFEIPSNNEWLAVNQFSIKGEKNTRRPDIVLFINGLPLVLIELKNSADLNADIGKAFNQIQTYKEQIPDIFQYNEILIISDGSEARMGSLSANMERFMSWRTIDGVTLDPLGQFGELETLTRGILSPVYFLDYIRFFILFEDDGELVKKIAGYHQFHAVRAAIQQVITASRPDGNKKGGVVWHTQGSGKSITMTCFAARVMREVAMENPTIVVITDRNDLDGQLFGVFSLGQDLLREQPVQAESRQDLRAKLSNRPSGGIVFATIQKFMLGEDEDVFPVLSDRRNIVVIADEAHRTQYGFTAELKGKSGQEKYNVGYAQHLRDALPNATFVAFTGTPVSSEDRDTRAVFGDYIHIYDMQQAKEDGATVAIFYESRLAKLSLNSDQIPRLDDDIDELAEDEEDSEQAKLKSRWAALEKVVGAEPRIKQVAADLINHFEERNKAQNGKAMIVGMSRDICVHLYNEIIELRPEWHSGDPAKGVVKVVMTGTPSDKALLRPHVYSKQVRKDLEKRFKKPDDELRLVIVRDMWLTGFDVPCAHTLYIDKPMKGHNLMQAIARVNRVFGDKQGGLVVDYIGIANDLKKALKDYTASNGHGRPTVDAYEAYALLEEKLDVLRSILYGFDYSSFLTSGHSLLAKAANHVLGVDDGKKRFADTALAMSKAFSLCCTLDEARAVREEVAFMQAVKVILTKRDFTAKKRTNEERELAIRQIISSAVVSDEVVDIFDAVGLDKPNIGILDEEFLAEVRELPERNLAVELLERLLEGEIRTRFSTNVIQEKKFSDLLVNTIRRYQNRAIETAQVMEELCDMAKKFKEAVNRGEELGLNEDELAFYDALANNETSVRELGDETLKKIAHELTESLRRNVSVDWSVRESVRAKLRLMVKRILRKYKYPPDKQEEAVELVLRQAESLSMAWS